MFVIQNFFLFILLANNVPNYYTRQREKQKELMKAPELTSLKFKKRWRNVFSLEHLYKFFFFTPHQLIHALLPPTQLPSMLWRQLDKLQPSDSPRMQTVFHLSSAYYLVWSRHVTLSYESRYASTRRLVSNSGRQRLTAVKYSPPGGTVRSLPSFSLLSSNRNSIQVQETLTVYYHPSQLLSWITWKCVLQNRFKIGIFALS